MAHENDLPQSKFIANLNQILSITIQIGIFLGLEGAQIRLAEPNVVEENDLVFILKCGRDKSPHVLVATIPVCKHYRDRPRAENLDVIPKHHGHSVPHTLSTLGHAL